MRITFDIDTSVPLSKLEHAILCALAAGNVESKVSIKLTDAPKAEQTPAPSTPTALQGVSASPASVKLPTTPSKPSLTEALVPTETVKAADPTPVVQTAAPVVVEQAEAKTDLPMPTLDQMRQAITAFVSHPHCGGTAATKGVFKRYGNATGLTGANPVPVDMYPALYEELTRLVRLAPPITQAG